jgi:tetratricopeptide (TPR) repeat protein
MATKHFIIDRLRYRNLFLKRVYFFGILLLIVNPLHAISEKDSLLSLLKSETISTDARAKTLIHLSWDLMYENTDSAFYYARQAAEISIQHKLVLDVADSYNALGVCQIVFSDYENAIVLLDSGLLYIERAKLLIQDSLNKDFSRRLNREMSLLTNIGNCYYHTAHYQDAIRYYLLANKIADQQRGGWRQAIILSSIGSSYNELMKFDLSLKYQFLSLDIAKQAQDSSVIANTLTNIGTIYFLMDSIEKSKHYTFLSMDIYEKLHLDYFLSTVYLNQAQNLIRQRKYDSANIYLDKTLRLLPEYPEKESEIFYNYQKGQYEQSNGNNSSAINYYQKAYLLSMKYGSDKYKLYSSYRLENLYALAKQFDSAYHYLKISKQLSDSLFSIESDKKLTEMEVKYQVSKRETAINNLKKQQERDQQIRLLLIILLLVIILSSTGIISSYIVRRKKTKQLHKTEKKLMATELLKNQVEQQKLTEDIEHKTKQLTTHALNMMQKNKLLQEVNDSIVAIVKKPDNLEESFRKLKRQINRSIKADDDWEVFKMYFEQINNTFFDSLKEINPKLTNHDLRLCALIKLNLNIKETAAVLNLSPNSIKSARYKLRKKLELKTADDLSEFIQNI